MSNTVDNIINYLQSASTLRAQVIKENLLDKIQELQRWQCQRLILSHQDLWRSPRFRPAMEFFVDELYGPKDFSQRDKDIARVVPKLARILPHKAIDSMEAALHLNCMSFELDYAMLKSLGENEINRNTYAAAYRAINQPELRIQQIDFIESLGNDLAAVVRVKGISMLISIARKPAELAGLYTLHEFLESGYKAFKKLGTVTDFTQPIVTREKELMLDLLENEGTNPLPKGI